MSQRKIKWRIRHILKDGRVLRPSEPLPVSKASLEAFRQYGEVASRAAAQREVPATLSEVLCLDYNPGLRRQVAAKTARMEPYS